MAVFPTNGDRKGGESQTMTTSNNSIDHVTENET